MPVTFEDLRDDENIRRKFMELTPNQRKMVFDKMKPPSGFTTSQVDLLKKKILLTPVITEEGEDDAPLEWKDVPLESLKSIPSSVVNFTRSMWHAVRNPVKTMTSMEDLLIGAVQKAAPRDILGTGKKENVEQLGQFFKERYGGIDELKNTIATDPVGFASDVSAFLSLGGIAARTAGNVSRVPSVARAGEKISRVAPMVDPVGAAGTGMSKLASKGVPRLARSFADSTIKPQVRSKLTEPQKLSRVDTLADEFIKKGLRLDRKAISTLDSEIKVIQQRISNIIEDGTKRNVKIKTETIVNALDDMVTELDGLGLKTSDITKNIKTIQKFKDEALKNSPEFLTPQQAQRFKVFSNKKYTPNVSQATAAVKKAAENKLRAATKTALEDNFPQLKLLNEKEGVLIELNNTISKRIRTLESTETIRSKGLIAGAGAATLSGITAGASGASLTQSLITGVSFGVGAYVTERIISNPNVQIAIARAINKANMRLAQAGTLHKFTQPAFQAGRASAESEQEDALQKQILRRVK